jgi:transcription initiation factor TFIIB
MSQVLVKGSTPERKETCLQCNGKTFIKDIENGEVVCNTCGLVLSTKEVDLGPEWRAYNTMEVNKRVRTGLGLKYSIYDKGLTTMIQDSKDRKGKNLSKENRIKYLRLKKFNNRSKISDTWRRNLSIAFSELDRICSILHIPNIIKERAAVTYRNALKEDLIRGRSIDAFVAASLYSACREEGLPRTLSSIADASTKEYSLIVKSYRLMIRKLNIRMPIDSPKMYLTSITSKHKLNPRMEIFSAEIMDKAQERRLHVGKNPRAVAAAALYLACVDNDEKIVQENVAKTAGTSSVTLRNRYKELKILV